MYHLNLLESWVSTSVFSLVLAGMGSSLILEIADVVLRIMMWLCDGF